MASLVYAVFADAAAAEQATAELTRNVSRSTASAAGSGSTASAAGSAGHPAFGVQVHTRAPLNGDDLPEAATEIGRNTIIAIVVGAAAGLALGLVAGLSFDIMGLTPAIGAMFGLVTGTLSGLLGGTMAGTRRPKAALREAAEQLQLGHVLLTIEVGDTGHVGIVEDILVECGAALVDHC
jgi:hypothetical protein